MAWRWQRLLLAQGIHDRLAWLVRAYFVALHGGADPADVDRRRRDADLRDVAPAPGPHGACRRERSCSSARSAARRRSTLAAVGFALAVGSYDIGPYLWVEGAFVVGTVVLGVLLFSRRARRPLARFVPLLRRLRIERRYALGLRGDPRVPRPPAAARLACSR